MPSNLHYIDPQTNDEYDAQYLKQDDLPTIMVDRPYKVILEITQFGMWGSKSYIIIRSEISSECYYYTLETFDEKPRVKRQGKAAS